MSGNLHKQKGTTFESLMVPLFQLWYPGASRRVQEGRYDKGDWALPEEDRFAPEGKNHRKLDLAAWYAEAVAEAKNLGVPYGVVFHKRRGYTEPEDQWATTTAGAFLAIANTLRGQQCASPSD